MRHGGYGPFDDDDDDDAGEAFSGLSGRSGFDVCADAEADVAAAPAPRARPAPRPAPRPGVGPDARLRPGRPFDMAGSGDERGRRADVRRHAADAAPPRADAGRQPPPAPAPHLDHADLADETLSAVARDLWRASVAWVSSIHRPLLIRLAGVLVVLAVVMALCASVLQTSLYPTPPTAHSSHTSFSASATPTQTSAATGGRFTGIVAVSYWAGHKAPFTASVTVSATLSWATTTPAPFSCGNFTLTFPGYNRPQNVTCQLTLPTGAEGVNAEQFQRCVSLQDANVTTLCWDNPAPFRRT